MPLNPELLSDIIYSYTSGGDSGSFNFESTQEQNDFWEWFSENAEELTSNNNLNDLVDDNTYYAGNCYGNSQAIALKHSKSYYEGFVLSKGFYIRHGFNFSDGNLQDFTIHYNKDNFREDNGHLPNHYVGIRIPNNFISDNRNADITTNYLNIDPLLLNYYRSTID